MFEIVYETRKHGTPPDALTPPLTSLVLESKFASAEEAKTTIEAFRRPFDERWEDGPRFCAANKGEDNYELWYLRPVE